MEIIIVIAILGILGVVLLVLFNPWTQIGKAHDARRKDDLSKLRNALEDYYNDKGCYPKAIDICYDAPVNVCQEGAGSPEHRFLESTVCHICGNESSSPSLSPYLSILPCDPQHKQKQYLYEVAAISGLACTALGDATDPCPQWYRTYSDLSNLADNSINDVGCQAGGCGFSPDYGYEYGATSPNTKLRRTGVYYCLTNSSSCDNCGSYESCKLNSSCKSIFAGVANCCKYRPKPYNCH